MGAHYQGRSLLSSKSMEDIRISGDSIETSASTQVRSFDIVRVSCERVPLLTTKTFLAPEDVEIYERIDELVALSLLWNNPIRSVPSHNGSFWFGLSRYQGYWKSESYSYNGNEYRYGDRHDDGTTSGGIIGPVVMHIKIKRFNV